MLQIQVEAESFDSLVSQLNRLLPNEYRVVAGVPSAGPLAEAAVPQPENATHSDTAAPRRGRPRKSTPAGASEVPAAQPAVASNTGSAPADTSPAAEGATGAAAEASAPQATTDATVTETAPSVVAAPQPMTPDDFRAALQVHLNALGNDTNVITAVFAEYGAAKWKQIDQAKYAEVLAKIEAAIKAKKS